MRHKTAASVTEFSCIQNGWMDVYTQTLTEKESSPYLVKLLVKGRSWDI